jgi:hypothetical protein
MAGPRSAALLAVAASVLLSDGAAAASPPSPAAAPAPAPAPPRREPTAAELLQYDPAYIARERRLEALYGNARDRDPTGEVQHEQAQALAQRAYCVDRACLDDWFRRREAALRQYVGN